MQLSVIDAATYMHARDATPYQSDLCDVMRDVLRNASCALRTLNVACSFDDDVLSLDIDEDDVEEVKAWLDDDIEAFEEQASEHAHLVLDIIASRKGPPTTH